MSIDPIRSNSTLLGGADLAIELGGDASARVAAMLLEHSDQKRTHLQQARQAEEEHLRATQESEIQAMRAEASHIRAAAESRAIGGIVSGGFQVASGIAMGNASCEREATAASKILGGSGELGKGLADLDAAASDYSAGQARVDGKAAENKASESERKLDDIAEEVREARELAKTALQFLRDVSEMEGEIQRAALFRA